MEFETHGVCNTLILKHMELKRMDLKHMDLKHMEFETHGFETRGVRNELGSKHIEFEAQ